MHSAFPKTEAAAFTEALGRTPRALVLFLGDHCPYSHRFRPNFEAFEGKRPEWTFLVREVEEGGWGPVAEAHGIERTPTVVAFIDGTEAARLEAKLYVGITKHAFARWLNRLDPLVD